MTPKEFKTIPGFPLYKINKDGDVIQINTKKKIKTYVPKGKNYLAVDLRCSITMNYRTKELVKLIIDTFYHPIDKYVVKYKDNDCTNFNIDNLEVILFKNNEILILNEKDFDNIFIPIKHQHFTDYLINRDGIIRNPKGTIVTGFKSNNGYRTCRLTRTLYKTRSYFRIDHLVINAFINPSFEYIVNFKDGNTDNVKLSNLIVVNKYNPLETLDGLDYIIRESDLDNDLLNNEYLQVPGFSRYKLNKHGDLLSHTGMQIYGTNRKSKTVSVQITNDNNEYKHVTLARLLIDTFIKPPYSYKVRFYDGDNTNITLSNIIPYPINITFDKKNSRLSDDIISKIYILHKLGYDIKYIKNKTNISETIINKIINKETYSKVTDILDITNL